MPAEHHAPENGAEKERHGFCLTRIFSEGSVDHVRDR
jgi:hypothetical protein